MFTDREFDYLMRVTKQNKENSEALAKAPGQKWKDEHEAEVVFMDELIGKLETIMNLRED